ncbi:MAG: ribonuclease HII [Thermodesulfobacteriota bacterium]
MKQHEIEALREGHRLIAGVDEAGRGPLAGPVVASAVLFSSPPDNPGIKDSKALTPAQRETILLSINREALAIGVGIVWPSHIDEINIHRASLLAMERAVEELQPAPHFLLIDGPFSIRSALPQKPVVRGDTLSITIAAASIVAKTVRDRIMGAYGRLYPEYGFLRNRGYGTKEHREALGRLGSTPIHRKSFKGVEGERCL